MGGGVKQSASEVVEMAGGVMKRVGGRPGAMQVLEDSGLHEGVVVVIGDGECGRNRKEVGSVVGEKPRHSREAPWERRAGLRWGSLGPWRRARPRAEPGERSGPGRRARHDDGHRWADWPPRRAPGEVDKGIRDAASVRSFQGSVRFTNANEALGP